MSEEQQTRGGFVRFLTTIPGVLTAVAAVVTAAGGIYLGTHKDPATPSPPPAPTALTVNLSMTGGTPPSAAISVDQQSLRLDNASTQSGDLSGNDPVQQLIDRCGRGDDSACLTILRVLTQECSDGYGISCDVLYEVSPVGSVYETYGATCGARFSEDYADTCRAQ